LLPPESGIPGALSDPQSLPLPLGDILICPEQVEKMHPSLPREEALCLMLAHGFLHLLAWDHDTSEKEEAMWARQNAIVSKLRAALSAPSSADSPSSSLPEAL
jgi:rRNA maturation RNase YbeY